MKQQLSQKLRNSSCDQAYHGTRQNVDVRNKTNENFLSKGVGVFFFIHVSPKNLKQLGKTQSIYFIYYVNLNLVVKLKETSNKAVSEAGTCRP